MAADEKTEKATPKRRQDERKKGNVFQSNDVAVSYTHLDVYKRQYTEYAAMTSRMSGKLSTLRYVINNTGK